MKRLVLLVAVMILSGAFTAYANHTLNNGSHPQQGSGGKSKVNVIGGDQDSLTSVIEFLVDEYGPVSVDLETTVYVGEIAEDFAPFELTLPDDAEIIGTVLYSNLPDEKYFRPNRLFITTALEPREVVEFYEESLGEEFSIPENSYSGPAGFTDPGVPLTGMYCYNRNEALFVFTAYSEDELTHVEVSVTADLYEGSVCSGTTGMPPFEGGAFKYMPQLSNPEEARVRLSGGGGSPDRAESSAAIWLDDVTAAELLELYMPQVEDAGWAITASSSDDLGSWLLATYEDDEGEVWSAQLTVLADPADDSAFNASLLVYR